jgi:hypothetical protein
VPASAKERGRRRQGAVPEEVDQEPTLEAAYRGLVTVSLNTQDYDGTAALLTQVRQRFHVQIVDLSGVPEFSGFVK